MKKRKFIPLIGISCLLVSCGINLNFLHNSESNDQPSTQEKEEEKKEENTSEELNKAKSEASSLIDSINIEDYTGQEKEDIQYLINGLNNLVNNATSAEQIYAAMNSIQEYLDNAKTKADYEREAEEQKQKDFTERKQELLKKASLERPNRFRKYEQDAIKAVGNALVGQIEAATTIEELNEISFDEFDSLVSNSITNAECTVKEWYYFHENSKWSLVNEHAANWPYQTSTFCTNGLGADDVAYQITSNKFHGELEVLLKCKNTVNSSENFGFLIGNMNPTGTGFDGYLVNYAYTTSHQYLQIWQFINANGMENATVYQYIGGWEYEKSYSTKLNQDEIRVFYDGEYIKLYREAEYQEKGELAQSCVVSLEYNNRYAVDPETNEYSIGFFNWDGANLNAPRILEIKELITEQTINSKDMLLSCAQHEIDEIDLSVYDSEDQQAITQKANELLAYIQTNNVYNDSFNKIIEFQNYVGTTKTAEQKELESHEEISVQILDNIYSGDTTKYTPSNWDLVNEHALAWNHTQGTHVVTTDGLAGYCMDAAVHTDFTVKFKVTGTQASNPYNASMPDSAIIIGGNISGNYFTGVEVVLSQNWGFQLYNSMAGANHDPACYADQFMGGIDRNSESSIYRLIVKNGILKVFLVNETTGKETQLSGVTSSFTNTSEWNLGTLSGHFGIMDWGGVTTYEILEYRDL